MRKRNIIITDKSAKQVLRDVKKAQKSARRADSKSNRKNRKKSKLRVSLIAMFVFFAVLIFGFTIYFIGFNSPIREDVSFTVRGGAGIGTVARELSDAGLIANESIFKLTVMGFGGRVMAGMYDIPAGTGTWRVAKMMVRGKVASTVIVIPEGMTVKQIVNQLDANRFLVGDTCRPHDLSADDEIATKRLKCPYDGELFPDTYRVAKGTHRGDVIELMRKKMKSIEDGWNASGKHAPAPLRDWNDVVTLASIVQKETPRVSEMPTVASVYLNRLRKKMKLQADPTVVYALTNGLGDIGGKVLWTNQLKFISPYNTYLHYGLPPRPIANVGADAIAAVLNPADTNYLFFVADGTGGHAFAKDYAEHQRNHATWREIKKSRQQN